MKRILWLLSPLLCVIGLAGCQCSGVTERYVDAIDHVSDYTPEWDEWYWAGLDLTRIGQPDWCSYGFNRWWCKRACCAAHCGDPCPELPCPFCLDDRRLVESQSPVMQPVPGNSPPKLPPAPGPPVEGAPTQDSKASGPALSRDELPTL